MLFLLIKMLKIVALMLTMGVFAFFLVPNMNIFSPEIRTVGNHISQTAKNSGKNAVDWIVNSEFLDKTDQMFQKIVAVEKPNIVAESYEETVLDNPEEDIVRAPVESVHVDQNSVKIQIEQQAKYSRNEFNSIFNTLIDNDAKLNGDSNEKK